MKKQGLTAAMQGLSCFQEDRPASDLEIVRGKGSERTYRLEERFVLRCRERSISERPAIVPGKDSVNKRVVDDRLRWQEERRDEEDLRRERRVEERQC